jgi:hypothetical protein
VHLLRDIHEVVSQHPHDGELAHWAHQVHDVYTRAVAFASPDQQERRQARWRFQTELSGLCQPYLPAARAGPGVPQVDDATTPAPLAAGEADEAAQAPQAGLCRRIAKYLHALFIFVLEPGVPADNNPAECSLRHPVISRKVSGGTRSAEGSDTKCRLATLFGTWRARGLDPLVECRRLLTSPQA